ncbi:MAG: DNA repair exonuclease, partial [Wujia sp.]
DVDFENKKIVDTFVPFASRNLYTIPVDVSGCESTSEVQQVISKTLAEQKIADIHMVKLVLCGNVSVDSERDISLLTNTCADNFFFVKIYDETKLAVDYEMYTHDESLKGEFVRQVQASGLDEDEKAEIIRTGILALAGEEFV